MTTLTKNSPPAPGRSFLRSFFERLLGFVLHGLACVLNYTFLPVNHFYGSCVGRVMWMFDTEVKRVTLANLKIAYPNLSTLKRNALAKESLQELGKTMTELGPLWRGSQRRVENLITEVRGEQVVGAARAEGRGVVFLAPHFGAWELVGLYLSLHYQIVSLYRPPRLAGIARFTRDARSRFGAELVPTDVSGVRALCRSLKGNNTIGILPDQDPGESGGIDAPFFGRSARTMLLASRLADKTNSEVVFCVAERLACGKGYRLHFVQGDSQITSKDEVIAATSMNEGIESIISINPAQYQWSYKRYRVSGKTDVNPYRKEVQPSELRRAA